MSMEDLMVMNALVGIVLTSIGFGFKIAKEIYKRK